MDERQKLADLARARNVSLEALSRLLGRNPAYIQQFIKRGTPRKLDEQDRHILARFFGIADSDLGGAKPQSRGRSVSDLVQVRRLALGASAGGGTLDVSEESAGTLGFDPRWMRDVGLSPTNLSIIRVDGESMAPTLLDGDDIMVDGTDGEGQLRDGIYVLRLDGVLMVKRVALGPQRGQLSILSDNPHFPDWPDIDPALVAIVGRVVWTGRRLG